ncbi:MAG TPA: hypothetical protein VH934_13115 [Xanthobacteraceae bacterium]|jgi:hypothetical protein
MSSSVDRLPSRFPVGTRYVVEGRGGGRGRLRIDSRYLVFPDGRHVELPADPAERRTVRRSRSRRRTARRK